MEFPVKRSSKDNLNILIHMVYDKLLSPLTYQEETDESTPEEEEEEEEEEETEGEEEEW